MTTFGYVPLLRNESYSPNVWKEAYGYLGSYYPSYEAARYEIDWLIQNYPERYTQWRIERVVIEDNHTVSHPLECVIAESKNSHHEVQA